MMSKKYTFEITAESPDRTDQVANALSTIYRKVPMDDIIWVAKEIKKDPTVITRVVKVANNKVVKGIFNKMK